jgi:hypothetical protein
MVQPTHDERRHRYSQQRAQDAQIVGRYGHRWSAQLGVCGSRDLPHEHNERQSRHERRHGHDPDNGTTHGQRT